MATVIMETVHERLMKLLTSGPFDEAEEDIYQLACTCPLT